MAIPMRRAMAGPLRFAAFTAVAHAVLTAAARDKVVRGENDHTELDVDAVDGPVEGKSTVKSATPIRKLLFPLLLGPALLDPHAGVHGFAPNQIAGTKPLGAQNQVHPQEFGGTQGFGGTFQPHRPLQGKKSRLQMNVLEVLNLSPDALESSEIVGDVVRVAEQIDVLQFPDSLKGKFKDPVLLQSGSFANVWSVNDDKKGESRVVKILHDWAGQDLTWRVAVEDIVLFTCVKKALSEFNNVLDIMDSGRTNNEGSEHIMKVFESNLDDSYINMTLKSPDEPLHMVLENCGDKTLREFLDHHLREGTWSPELVLNIYEQVLKGLAYLHRHPMKWVHHDLNPSNIVVRTDSDGKVEVRFVDFGEAVSGLPGKESRITSSTQGYYGPEWDRPACSEAGCPQLNFAVSDDPDDIEEFSRLATSFDMYSAAVIFHELVTGCTPASALTIMDNVVDKGEMFQVLGEKVKNPGEFVDQMESLVYFEQDSPFYRVLLKTVSCLSNDAAVRPTAEDILSIFEGHNKHPAHHFKA